MKKTPSSLLILLLVFSFFWSQSVLSQPMTTGWQWGISASHNNNPGFDAGPAIIDDSGNVIVTGGAGSYKTGAGMTGYMVFGADTVYDSTAAGQDMIIKADSSGNFRWAKSLACNPAGLIADHSGNLYILGIYVGSLCSFDTITLLNPSGYDMYCLVKYSPAGNAIWAKNIIGNTRYAFLGAIGLDGSGNIYVTGAFDLPARHYWRGDLNKTPLPEETPSMFLST